MNVQGKPIKAANGKVADQNASMMRVRITGQSLRVAQIRRLTMPHGEHAKLKLFSTSSSLNSS
jgi:hypothetical protein